MLSKEEIKEIKEDINDYIHDWLDNSINEDGYEINPIDDYNMDFINNVQTLLQYIDQLEQYLEKISKQLDNVAIDQIPIGIKELQQENKTLTHTNKSYKGIINKQNKIIDEMAEYIVELIKFNNWEELREVEEIKQYFEKKVEEK